MDEDLMKMKKKAAEEYDALPDFFKRAIDRSCPLCDDFSSEEEEKKWLRKRLSRLSSLYMGMASGLLIVIVAALSIGIMLVKALLAWRFS